MDISQYCEYSTSPSEKPLTIITSGFFDDGIYGTKKTIPATPFQKLPESDIPFLFGHAKIERLNGKIILYADLIASTYFLLSRYEEIVKPECRDQHGRFLAKDSVVFQQGFGFRPLVDEWGLYLRNLLREVGVDLAEEKKGFTKIYLTHDVDVPFQFFKFRQVIKQWIKNLIHYGIFISQPYRKYINGKDDAFYITFQKMITYDSNLQKHFGKSFVESIYFLISAGKRGSKEYCNIESRKFKTLVNELKKSDATLGYHVSYEAGKNPRLIKKEINRLSSLCDISNLKSRHHYLRWTEPEHIEFIQDAGIKDDFSLGYADAIGFRCGTSKSYHFINPKTQKITNVLIHPMQIMECSLDRQQYMNLNYESAFDVCKKVIFEVYKHNGELNLLFHNTSFIDEYYHDRLYKELLDYVVEIK